MGIIVCIYDSSNNKMQLFFIFSLLPNSIYLFIFIYI
uniref:Uncharacterized protein n=1 Tax=Heterorhabditis bacteriophora TaxID=37862 RepID=A0A1I7WKZ7_HETBA